MNYDNTKHGAWHQPEDPEELVNLRVSVKQRLLGSKLSKDGAGAPDIDRGGVPGRTQKDLGSSVPQGHHLEHRGPLALDETSRSYVKGLRIYHVCVVILTPIMTTSRSNYVSAVGLNATLTEQHQRQTLSHCRLPRSCPPYLAPPCGGTYHGFRAITLIHVCYANQIYILGTPKHDGLHIKMFQKENGEIME